MSIFLIFKRVLLQSGVDVFDQRICSLFAKTCDYRPVLFKPYIDNGVFELASARSLVQFYAFSEKEKRIVSAGHDIGIYEIIDPSLRAE